jgi:hypothetical protein
VLVPLINILVAEVLPVLVELELLLKSELSKSDNWIGSEFLSSIILGLTSFTSIGRSHCAICSLIFSIISGEAMTVTCFSERYDSTFTVPAVDGVPEVVRRPLDPRKAANEEVEDVPLL